MSRCLRIVIGALLVSAIASAQAKKLELSDLPEPVQAAATKASAEGKVTGYWQRDQDGAVIYEVDLVVDGHGRAVLINPEGVVVAVQEEVPWPKLDPNVQAGIQSQAGEGKVTRVFSISRDGQVSRYIAVVENGDQKTKVQVGADGAPLAASPAPNPAATPAAPPASPPQSP